MWKWASKLALKVYGHWCGPGHSGPQSPIDVVDAACRDHDLCYATHGWGNPMCDAYLVHELSIRLDHPSTLTKRGYVFAWVIYFVFSLRPSVRAQLLLIEQKAKAIQDAKKQN